MEIGIKQIFALFLVLVTLGAITTSITYIFFWILFRIYRWLYKHTWFSKKVVQTQSGIRKFWNKYLPNLTNLWEFFCEVLADPIFYGYALVVLVDRIESINQYAKQYPQYNFFQILESDMNADITFYIIFVSVFTLWMLGKAWKHNQDAKDKKALRDSLVSISKVLEKMNKGIGKLSRNLNIKENTKRKGE